MNCEQIIQTIERGRIIAILRGDFQWREGEMVAAMLEAGISAVEVTLNSPDALGTIKRLAGQFGAKIAIGAGTVLKAEQVAAAADAGARFIVSPNRNIAVIEATKRRDMVSIPGCFTPSEIIEALEAGADAAKLFPAVCLGPAFVKSMRGPLGAVRMVPTGSVNPELARDYMKASAWAIGVGSELVNPDVLSAGGIDRLAVRAAAFVAAVGAV